MQSQQSHPLKPIALGVIGLWLFWAIIGSVEALYWAKTFDELPKILVVKLIQLIPSVAFGLFFLIILHRLSQKQINLVCRILLVIILCYLFSLVAAFVNTTISRYLNHREPVIFPLQRYTSMLAFTKIFLFLGISGLYYLFMYKADLQQQREKTLTAEALANKTRLQMLKYQLNPHFLFNALNTIRTSVYKDAKSADVLITELSDLLRYSLKNKDQEQVALSEEIDMIRHYLHIQKMRFGDALHIEENLPQHPQAIQIPGFLLHPLLENAVKYGMKTSPMPLQIKLNIASDEHGLRITVRNSGKLIPPRGVDEKESTGTGLENIRRRLELYYPDKYEMRLDEAGGFVNAHIGIMY